VSGKGLGTDPAQVSEREKPRILAHADCGKANDAGFSNFRLKSEGEENDQSFSFPEKDEIIRLNVEELGSYNYIGEDSKCANNYILSTIRECKLTYVEWYVGLL
jgi:hypothetical protein